MVYAKDSDLGAQKQHRLMPVEKKIQHSFISDLIEPDKSSTNSKKKSKKKSKPSYILPYEKTMDSSTDSSSDDDIFMINTTPMRQQIYKRKNQKRTKKRENYNNDFGSYTDYIEGNDNSINSNIRTKLNKSLDTGLNSLLNLQNSVSNQLYSLSGIYLMQWIINILIIGLLLIILYKVF